jgi:hypothetical protein
MKVVAGKFASNGRGRAGNSPALGGAALLSIHKGEEASKDQGDDDVARRPRHLGHALAKHLRLEAGTMPSTENLSSVLTDTTAPSSELTLPYVCSRGRSDQG